jgi:dissimilatory sulfite reductase (desulfoviridin) alpha/beta subunit
MQIEFVIAIACEFSAVVIIEGLSEMSELVVDVGSAKESIRGTVCCNGNTHCG